jgi:hypothetical protein
MHLVNFGGSVRTSDPPALLALSEAMMLRSTIVLVIARLPTLATTVVGREAGLAEGLDGGVGVVRLLDGVVVAGIVAVGETTTSEVVVVLSELEFPQPAIPTQTAAPTKIRINVFLWFC